MVAEVSASRSVAIRDVTLVVAVSLVYLGFEFLSIPKRWSFLFAGLALGAYVVYLAVDRRHSWHDLGFRRDNLTAGLLPVGVCTALVGAGLVAFAVVQRRAVWQPAVLVLLALYPLWALAQQFAFQGLLHGGLTVLVQSSSLQVLLTAAAVASVHIGNTMLLALTFVAGIMWPLLFRRWPKLRRLSGPHSTLSPPPPTRRHPG